MLNFFAIALIQIAGFTAGSTPKTPVLQAPISTHSTTVSVLGGTGGWGGDVASIAGGTGGWGGDVASIAGGTGGWGGDIVA